MRSIDNSVDALLFWASAALTSSERILSGDNFSPWARRRDAPPMSHMKELDAALMLLALRNVIRAAEWSASDLRDQNVDASDWLATFRQLMPDLVKARDALEHFDAYATGRGRLQRSQPGQYSFSFTDCSDPVASVGPFSIPVRAAQQACRWLVIRLLAAYEIDQDQSEAASALLDEVLKAAADDGQ